MARLALLLAAALGAAARPALGVPQPKRAAAQLGVAQPKRAAAQLGVTRPTAEAAALALRGGASLGPITPSVGVKFYVLAMSFYVIQLYGLDPTVPDPVLKYFGVPGNRQSKGIFTWEACALAVAGSLAAYAAWVLGVDNAALCKFFSVSWAFVFLQYVTQLKQGLLVMTEAPYIMFVMSLLYGFLGFA